MQTHVLPLRAQPDRIGLTPEPIDWLLAAGAVLLLGLVVVALARGRPEWSTIPVTVWTHLATIMGALVLTPVMLLRRRGDRLHRLLGRVWIALLMTTALISFGIRDIMHGSFSPIHLISLFVLVDAPLIAWTASRGNIRAHRRTVRFTIAGALLIAGFFTFPFGRLLGRWLFG